MGPRMLPCGTPAVTVLEEERGATSVNDYALLASIQMVA